MEVIIIRDTVGKKKLSNGSFIDKSFKKGEIYNGNLRTSGGMLPENQIRFFLTDKGYVLGLDVCQPYVKQRDSQIIEMVDANVVTDSDLMTDESRKKLENEKLFDVKNIIQNTKDNTKNIVAGAIIGGVVGLLIAMYQSKSKIAFSLIGALSGGIGGKIYSDMS